MGNATPEQLQAVGRTIQSLADTATKSTNSQSTSSTTTASAQTPVAIAPASVPPPSFGPTSSTSTTQQSVLALRPPQPYSSGTFAYGSYPPSTMQTIKREPDVVIEFFENQQDRWLLPKDLVLYERSQRWEHSNILSDVIFSTLFPFEGSRRPAPPPVEGQGTSKAPEEVYHPITLRFFNVPETIWSLFAAAAADVERTKRVSAAMDAKV